MMLLIQQTQYKSIEMARIVPSSLLTSPLRKVYLRLYRMMQLNHLQVNDPHGPNWPLSMNQLSQSRKFHSKRA